ncbi:efflux RND transporter periplasmic adaptor subunit [Paenibacillus sp. 32352]|uniref:efflux RND transporter periplasmic adaptor subunit n=1 Tax=Paenibacillus sp. 32352 TaxID=1969111 RepID=UPI002117DB24|nr:biotin/lipoyl-binding protein [Paenibacillus sp. 32352]
MGTEQHEELGQRRRKRSILIVFGLFIGLLLFFTLFSNTLQSMALPKVKTEKPTVGSIEHRLEGSGILQPLAEAKLTNPAGWKVTAIAVKEGDIVNKGQPLVAYDSKTAERELQDELAQLEKQKIELQNVQDQYIASATGGDAAKSRRAGRDIETRKIDLGVQERKINELLDRLAKHKQIAAPFDGIVTKVNAVEGLASAGEPDVVMTNNSRGYRLELSVDASLLLSLGIAMEEKLQVEVRMPSDPLPKIVEGTVYEIAETEPRTDSSSAGKQATIAQKTVRVKVADPGLNGGEQAFVKLAKPSHQEGRIVSNEAVHSDREGRFVYKIEERRGALGNVFIVRKARVQAMDSNDKATRIESSVVQVHDLIIVESSEPLQEGNRVRLE